MTTRRKPAVVHPAPGGASAHERADWLDALPPLAFLQEVRARHQAAAHEWAAAVDRAGETRGGHAELEAGYRKSVRAAIAVGDEPPERPRGLDAAAREARDAIALEDAHAARDDLSRVVIEALSVLREHVADVRPYFPALSPALLGSLSFGVSNRRALVTEQLRRHLTEFEATPAFEVLDAGDDSPAPELEDAHV